MKKLTSITIEFPIHDYNLVINTLTSCFERVLVNIEQQAQQQSLDFAEQNKAELDAIAQELKAAKEAQEAETAAELASAQAQGDMLARIQAPIDMTGQTADEAAIDQPVS